ncbi:hypothetical protein OYC64_014497 [Pagothenia borchgrevinki]|uniref:J domain-containing protein n=1 Tax=Pagothenia borchgrevinki TaxID=8213 RepID=A0ABD2H0X1_PAGBO
MSCTFHLMVSHSGFYHGRFLLVLSRQSLLLRELSSMHQMSRSLRESSRILQLPDEAQSSPGQVKEAYLRLAKHYHPDSGAPTADAVLFARVEDAYRAVLAHQTKTNRTDGGKQVEDEDNSRGKAFPHRHYLRVWVQARPASMSASIDGFVSTGHLNKFLTTGRGSTRGQPLQRGQS